MMSVIHNGTLIHDKQVVPKTTGAAGAKGHAALGPIMLQDHGNRVRYRNIWIEELKAKD